MEARPIQHHRREHHSVTAAAEKRVLIWIAGRLPRWVTSDQLTALAVVSMLLAGCLFWAARWQRLALPFVAVALLANWFGDSLDGTLARVRNQQRPRYGFYVDHVLDVLGVSFLLGGLSLSGFMSPLIALALLSTYLMVAAEVFLATSVQGVFRMAAFGFGPTELRIVLAAGAISLMRSPVISPLGFGPYRLFDFGGVLAILGLCAAFLVSAIRNGRQLYLEEPLGR